MSFKRNKTCSCKGIRKCLLCEDHKENELQHEEAKDIFTFCPYCGLCWPDLEDASICKNPLYLGKIKVFEEFITENEEILLISEIDKIPWTPSQSGRRKQDFGPKVNFKKKRVKIGDFKGFPTFSKIPLQKFENIHELNDFQPVELCHLEYTPERGSSIDPHIDDFWLWGERLVTINLNSWTVLTLLPFSNSKCECLEESSQYFERNDCDVTGDTDEGILASESSSKALADIHFLYQNKMVTCNHKLAELSKKNYDFCSTFCLGTKTNNVAVRVKLPPRSLLILSGCARYNWYHEIKRKDISARRIAVTFRELSQEFLFGGEKSEFGQDLLSVAGIFYNLSQCEKPAVDF